MLLRMEGAGWTVDLKGFFITQFRKNRLLAHKFFWKNFFVSQDLLDRVLAQKIISWQQVVWDPVVLHLEREYLTLRGDVQEPLVELLERHAHQLDKVLKVDEISVPAQKFGINIFHKLLQKRFFDLNGGSDGVA